MYYVHKVQFLSEFRQDLFDWCKSRTKLYSVHKLQFLSEFRQDLFDLAVKKCKILD
jgi:hypothetical protein